MNLKIIEQPKKEFLVSSKLHSVFFEYFGKVIYDGIWVGNTDEGYYALLKPVELYQYDIDLHRITIREPTRICDRPFAVEDLNEVAVPPHSVVRICLERK